MKAISIFCHNFIVTLLCFVNLLSIAFCCFSTTAFGRQAALQASDSTNQYKQLPPQLPPRPPTKGIRYSPAAAKNKGSGVVASAPNENDPLQVILGGTARGDLIQSVDSTLRKIEVAADLNCIAGGEILCRWRNVQGDELDWFRGDGKPDRANLKLITGTDTVPDAPYMVLGSTPRHAEDIGLLVSDPIGCQIGDGAITFRHWITRSRRPGHEPILSICWRHEGERILRDCTSIQGPHPGPTTARILGTIVTPFEIVFQGEQFTNEPDGGLIILDSITYAADVTDECERVVSREEFERRQREKQQKPLAELDEQDIQFSAVGSSNSIFDDDDDDSDEDYLYPRNDAIKPPGVAPPPPPLPTVLSTTISPDYQLQRLSSHEEEPHIDESFDIISCQLVSCTFSFDEEFCNWNPVGVGSVDVGNIVGWRVVSGDTNLVNPLTGIKYDYTGSRQKGYAVATFPDPNQDPVNPQLRFVMESPEITFSRGRYLTFRRFMATEGVSLFVCRTPHPEELDNCEWRSPPLQRGFHNVKKNREWREETIFLPAGTFTLYLIASYDGAQIYNAGQIGISYIKILDDGHRPLCDL